MNNLQHIRHAKPLNYFDIVSNTKHPRFRAITINRKNLIDYCFACGSSGEFVFSNIINNELAKSWGLSEDLRLGFDIRESTNCKVCGNSLRSNFHAKAISKTIDPGSSCLKEAVISDNARKLRVAEINACGALHQFLLQLPGLEYSEYMTDDSNIRSEDLNQLSYNSDSFDIVLTSDTLEHLPDWSRAAKEIRRVLKPNGVHIFTVPAILTRLTRTRAIQDGKKIAHLLSPSYHGRDPKRTADYTVYNEFGADFRREIDKLGFRTQLYYTNLIKFSDPNFVFVSTKV